MIYIMKNEENDMMWVNYVYTCGLMDKTKQQFYAKIIISYIYECHL